MCSVSCPCSHYGTGSCCLFGVKGGCLSLLRTLSDKTVQSANTVIFEAFSCLYYSRTAPLKCHSEYECTACWRNGVKPGMPAIKEQGGRVLQASNLPAACILACSTIHNKYIWNFWRKGISIFDGSKWMTWQNIPKGIKIKVLVCNLFV